MDPPASVRGPLFDEKFELNLNFCLACLAPVISMMWGFLVYRLGSFSNSYLTLSHVSSFCQVVPLYILLHKHIYSFNSITFQLAIASLTTAIPIPAYEPV